jgi:hypothetical protein
MALGHIALPVSTIRGLAVSGLKLIYNAGNTVFEPGRKTATTRVAVVVPVTKKRRRRRDKKRREAKKARADCESPRVFEK